MELNLYHRESYIFIINACYNERNYFSQKHRKCVLLIKKITFSASPSSQENVSRLLLSATDAGSMELSTTLDSVSRDNVS